MSRQTQTYNFALILSGVTEPSAKVEDALFKAGCDDAILAFRNDTAYLEFDRKADSHEQAVLSAIRAVEKAGVGLTVEHVEPSDIVTASEISRRLNCTRENVRLLSQGKRAKLEFPPPLFRHIQSDAHMELGGSGASPVCGGEDQRQEGCCLG